MTRGSPGAERVGGLDAVRAIAALLVVASHARLPGFDFAGQAGVSLFLVLSGYLITSLLLEERARTGAVAVRAFLFRRVVRLAPALLLLVYVDAAVNGIAARGLLALTPVSNWAALAGGDLGQLSHVWSLAVEAQFYLLWPLVLPTRRAVPVLVALAIASLLIRVALMADPVRVQLGTDTRADALLIGAALALVGSRPALRWPVAIAAAAILLGVSTDVLGVWSSSIGLSLVGVAGAGLVLFGIRWQAPRWLAFVGRVSYGLYLWHVWILASFRPAIDPLPAWARVLVIGGGGLLLAIASWYLVERPVLRWARRAVAGGRQPEGSPDMPLTTQDRAAPA